MQPEVLNCDDIAVLIVPATKAHRRLGQTLSSALSLVDQTEALPPLHPILSAAAIYHRDVQICHGRLLSFSDERRPHWRHKGSRIAKRPREAASGGTEMR